MKAARVVLPLAALVAFGAACSSPSESAPRPTYGALGAGEVARVAGVSLGAPLVAAVAAARATDPRTAASSLVEDALAAEGARARRLDGEPVPRWAATVALARRVPYALAQDARAAGPPSDDELATLTVVHVVVMRTRSVDGARGVMLAGRVRDAVVGARDEDDFLARADAATQGAIRASVERLPSFDATGRFEDGRELDPDFVAGAFELHTKGETSPIVETSFGWHVIRLVSRVVPTGGDADARRQAVAPIIESLRARMRLAEVLRARRGSSRVEISPAAEELMSHADTAP